MVGSASPSSSLTEPQIDAVVRQYMRQMARFEKTAAAVADRLRRELRAEGQPRYLLSFRAKHPEDLRGKLRRKKEDPRYCYEALMSELGDVVTDLAGCRVVVYTVPDEERVTKLVRRVFHLPHRNDAQPAPLRRAGGYQATHSLVLVPEGDDDTSVRGTICEVQVATVAAHLFNELEHDITYKQLGHEATDAERRLLGSVERACKLADHLVEQLLDARARGTADASVLSVPAELRLVLERATGHPLDGDFAKLFSMLETVVDPLTPASVLQHGAPAELIARGMESASRLQVEADDVIAYVLGIMDMYASEFGLIAKHWRGPKTPLRRAIQAAIGASPQMEQTVDDSDAVEA